MSRSLIAPRQKLFERYLKSGSGHAFARKRLWQLATQSFSRVDLFKARRANPVLF
jgi:hypothetical protein